MQNFETVESRVIRRECGGWIAFSRPGSRLQVGVIGPNEDEARKRFSASIAKWIEILTKEMPDQNLDQAS